MEIGVTLWAEFLVLKSCLNIKAGQEGSGSQNLRATVPGLLGNPGRLFNATMRMTPV